MATFASGDRPGELSAYVTACALRGGMGAGEWEPGLGMIELGSFPLNRGVADIALGGESGGRMVGVGRTLVILQVATGAGCGRAGVLAAHMATGAGDCSVGTGQRELCLAVVKLGALPLSGRVAGGAFLAESGGLMVRRSRALEVLQMASGASLWCPRELAPDMAALAGERRVSASERKLRHCGVIEVRTLPLRCGVTHCAVLRESRGRMLRRLGGGIVLQVAAFAGGCRAGEPVPDMAAQAGNRRMCASQGKVCARGVVKPGALPLSGGVAGAAALRECRGHVGRVCGSLEGLDMTALASLYRTGILARHMAECALHIGVCSG